MPKPPPIAAILYVVSSIVHPAIALDCAKATAPQEKAICSTPEALVTDEAMAKAYQALYASLAEPDKKTLLLSQRAWLKLRTNLCPEEASAAAALCLKQKTEERRTYLEGRPDAGPGSGGRLAPVLIQQPGRKGSYEIDVTALKYAAPSSPGEMLFNSEVDRLLKDVPTGKQSDVEHDRIYSFDLHLRITYASPHLISAHVETYQFTGGAHGNSGANNINVDVGKAKILGFADVFPKAAEPKLDSECMRQILAQKAEKMPDMKISGEDEKQLRSAVAEGVGKLDRWSFSPGKAEVGYDPYELGAYVEGSYSCTFTKEFLRSLAKREFALP
jgi:uncharacterized protein YecT (DUF1311 family)